VADQEKAATPLPPGCLTPVVVVVVVFALLVGVCTFSAVSNLGDPSEKPSPVYELCADAMRSIGMDEADQRWLRAVSECMVRLSPSTTLR
jgi:hypothetical protein